MNSHLTDEQWSELLYGEPTPEVNRHLPLCSECQAEFRKLRASLDDFAALGLKWADRRASASISPPSAFVRNWASMSAGAAAAAALAAVALFMVHQEEKLPQVSVAAVQPTDYASEVAADDRLMVAIDKEIRWQTESAVANVDLGDSAGASHTRPSHRLTN
jgi:hypothetical protein